MCDMKWITQVFENLSRVLGLHPIGRGLRLNLTDTVGPGAVPHPATVRGMAQGLFDRHSKSNQNGHTNTETRWKLFEFASCRLARYQLPWNSVV